MKINRNRFITLSAAMVCAMASAQTSAQSYDCVELELFAVDKEHIDDREAARASMIPPEVLNELRQFVAIEIPLEISGMATRNAPDESCPDAATALVFGGKVTDYKKGNQVARYLVGFGAGKQKFAVDAWVKRKQDGSVLKQGEVVDRKIGGLLGGSKDKGKSDFGEKVADFIHSAMTGQKES